MESDMFLEFAVRRYEFTLLLSCEGLAQRLSNIPL